MEVMNSLYMKGYYNKQYVIFHVDGIRPAKQSGANL